MAWYGRPRRAPELTAHRRLREGRILMARGRDAADVAIATTFGPNTLESFRVWTDVISYGEIPGTAG